jgi:hypothetical protein
VSTITVIVSSVAGELNKLKLRKTIIHWDLKQQKQEIKGY